MKKLRSYGKSFIGRTILCVCTLGLCCQPAFGQVPSLDSLDRLAEEQLLALDSLDKALDKLVLQTEPVAVSRYHADITIHPEGYFDVEENYEVQFNQPRHGIYRDIPLSVRLEGDTKEWYPFKTHEITIDQVKVPGHSFKISKDPFSAANLNIRIGDADKYVEGTQHYTIQYRVRDAFLFEDSLTYFYWNLLGSKWEFPFYNVSFSVQLPNTPAAKAFVYTGLRGDTSSNALFSYKNGVFSGEATASLGSGRDMTLLLHLPADYIQRPGALSVWYKHYGWSLFILGAMLLFLLAWYLIGRDNNPVKTVAYFPPAGMNPASAGFLADEKAHNRDLTALIPYWGAQGLLSMQVQVRGAKKIRGAEKKGKLKLSGGQKAKIALGGIYSFIMAIVFFVSLKNLLFSVDYSRIRSILEMFVPALLITSPFIFLAFRTLIRRRKIKELTLHKKADLPPGAPLYERTMFNGLFASGDSVSTAQLKDTFYTTLNKARGQLKKESMGRYFTRHSKRNVIITIVICIIAGIAGGIWLGFSFNFIGGLLFFLTCIGLCVYSGAMRKRVVDGDATLQQVEGFRLFIKRAKKHELELLVKEDPGYFEDTLAYAVAFDLAERYSRKFEGLVGQPPGWYSGNGSHFTVRSFSTSFDAAMASTAATLVSSPSSSGSGGGSSGGGSSGGGFGGGGGGSW